MKTYTKSGQQDNNKPISNTETKTPDDVKPTFQFKDNRPETLVQRKLQALASQRASSEKIAISKKGHQSNFQTTSKQLSQNKTGLSNNSAVIQKVPLLDIETNPKYIVNSDNAILHVNNNILMKAFNKFFHKDKNATLKNGAIVIAFETINKVEGTKDRILVKTLKSNLKTDNSKYKKFQAGNQATDIESPDHINNAPHYIQGYISMRHLTRPAHEKSASTAYKEINVKISDVKEYMEFTLEDHATKKLWETGLTTASNYVDIPFFGTMVNTLNNKTWNKENIKPGLFEDKYRDQKLEGGKMQEIIEKHQNPKEVLSSTLKFIPVVKLLMPLKEAYDKLKEPDPRNYEDSNDLIKNLLQMIQKEINDMPEMSNSNMSKDISKRYLEETKQLYEKWKTKTYLKLENRYKSEDMLN